MPLRKLKIQADLIISISKKVNKVKNKFLS